MPSSRMQRPPTEFTTTSMKLRGEIRNALLPQVTALDMFKQDNDSLAASRTFYVTVNELDDQTYQVGVKYRSIHLGSTVAQIHLCRSATDLQEAIEALLASLTDGWIWEVS
ncbi:MAG: hypothetical protein AB7N91_16290 [Candidatus Tectimicrobiota bacterium]